MGMGGVGYMLGGVHVVREGEGRGTCWEGYM